MCVGTPELLFSQGLSQVSSRTTPWSGVVPEWQPRLHVAWHPTLVIQAAAPSTACSALLQLLLHTQPFPLDSHRDGGSSRSQKQGAGDLFKKEEQKMEHKPLRELAMEDYQHCKVTRRKASAEPLGPSHRKKGQCPSALAQRQGWQAAAIARRDEQEDEQEDDQQWGELDEQEGGSARGG